MGFQWRPPLATPSLDDISFLLDKSTRDFISRAVSFDKKMEHAIILSFDVYKTEVGDAKKAAERAVHWTALYCPESKELLLQTPASAKNFTKESLVSLLEIAEELGCETVFAAIDKEQEDLKLFSRAYMYFDFKIVDPRVRQFEGCLLFGAQL